MKVLLALVVLVFVAAVVAGAQYNARRWRPTTVMDVRATPDALRLDLSLATCNAEHRHAVEETATEVRITVEHRHATRDDCADAILVALRQPLGSRAVIDDRTDAAIPVVGP